MAVDRQRAGDVGGIERVHLDPHVEQGEIPRLNAAVVAHPVKRGGMRARGDDRAVAHIISFETRPPPEGAFDPPLAPVHAVGHRHLTYALGEPAAGRRDGAFELADLEFVLVEPELAGGNPEGLLPLASPTGRILASIRGSTSRSSLVVPGASRSSAASSSSSGRQRSPRAAEVSRTPRRGPTQSSP